MFPLPWLEPPAAGGPWFLPVAWLALAVELDDKSLGRFPSLSAPHPREGEAGEKKKNKERERERKEEKRKGFEHNLDK